MVAVMEDIKNKKESQTIKLQMDTRQVGEALVQNGHTI